MPQCTATVVLKVICLSLAVILSLEDPSGTKCTPVDGISCSCQTDQGIINLSSLSSSDGPKFTGIKDPSGFTYSYNPCKTFWGPDECSLSVYICQKSKDYNFAIADGDESIYIDDHGTPYVYYTGVGLTEAMVYLTCDKSVVGDGELIAKGGSNDSLVYHFFLKSAYVCPGGLENAA